MAKILLLTSDYFPNNGGVSQYTQNIYKLLKDDFDIKIIVFGINGKNTDNITYIKKGKSTWLYYINKIVKDKYNYIFVATIFPIAWMLNLLKVNAKKVFFLYGGEIIQDKKYKPRPSIVNIAKKADILISISKYTQSLIPIESSVFYPLIENKNIEYKKEKRDHHIIGSIGRMVKHKNYISIIENIKNINQKSDKKIIYHLAGDGPLLNEYKRYVDENQLNDLIVFWGKIDEDKKDMFFKTIDLLIVPSIKTEKAVEGFGMVVQEAGLYKVPSIGYNSGGLKESLEFDYISIQEENEELLMDRIVEILSDENIYNEQKEKAYNRAKKYTISKMHLNNFKKIL